MEGYVDNLYTFLLHVCATLVEYLFKSFLVQLEAGHMFQVAHATISTGSLKQFRPGAEASEV